MGQLAPSQNQLLNHWTFVDYQDEIQIYKNQLNQLAEKYVIPADPRISQNDLIAAYRQRWLPSKPIVNAYDALFVQKSSNLCSDSSTITVYAEYIPYRLRDIKMLNHGQGMYVLSEALAGFAQLYGRIGPFQIYEDLIGFNQQGQTKVWHNSNFADNSVNNDKIILMSTINPYDFDRKFSQNQEYDMVEDTIYTVARYTKFQPVFLQQAEEIKRLSFKEAHRIIANQIAQRAYYVPDHLILRDRNGVIQKSGITLKHRQVKNLSKIIKGQQYPYFTDSENDKRTSHTHYIQGQPYNNYEANSSESSLQGYYNLNGQNYRILTTKQIQGSINEQELIDEILKRNEQNRNGQVTNLTSPKVLNNNPQYFRENIDRSGHIESQIPQQNSKNQNAYVVNQNQQYPKQTVRVYSIGDGGKIVEENYRENRQNFNHGALSKTSFAKPWQNTSVLHGVEGYSYDAQRMKQYQNSASIPIATPIISRIINQESGQTHKKNFLDQIYPYSSQMVRSP